MTSWRVRPSSLSEASALIFDGSAVAPLVTALLQSQGATVTRVTGPWCQPGAGADHQMNDVRAIDLESLADSELAAVSAEVARADLVIDTTERGEMERWGFGFEAVRSLQPQVIYCRIPSFPDYMPAGGGEAMVSAAAGLWDTSREQPVPESLPVASVYAAVMAAYWAGVALASEEPGRAAYVETPLYNAGLIALGRRVIHPHDDRLADPLRAPRIPLAEIYECADGRHVQVHGGTLPFIRAVVDFGKPEWAERALSAGGALEDSAEVPEWRALLAELMRTRSAAAWEAGIAARGGACTPCLTRSEWMASRHARDSEIIVEYTAESGQKIRQVGAPVTVRPSQHAPMAAGDGSRRRRPARRVADMRVLDLCIVLAGPTCGRFLSEAGAGVVKVDPPARPVSPYGWLEVNRGKRSMLVDLTEDEGKSVLWRLLEDADVVLENYRSGKLRDLGFGYKDVSARFPDIIYGSFNAFDYSGPWESRPGWEHNAQAATGMQVTRGRPGRPVPVRFPVNDYGTGLLGAFGIVSALLERNRTGRGQHVTGSLARTASFMQSPWLRCSGDNEGTVPTDHLTLYHCSDGWVAADRDLPVSSRRSGPISSRSLDKTCAKALEYLRARGFAAMEVADPDTILDSEALAKSGAIAEWELDTWGGVTQLVCGPAASPDFVGPGWPAPDPGKHTTEVLAEAGYDEAAITRLMKTAVVASRRPLFGGQPLA
jgi:crotonobetainyl-CoA:carnitine CoA-transferase CaiB-like acyl-CoA transferase